MYRGYNLTYHSFNQKDYEKGFELYSSQKNRIEKRLASFITDDNSIDGLKMQANWFPQINADVFISHSHHDENIAISLAGWLSRRFEITSFIDSCIWGYAGDLLEMIDNEYCLEDKKNRIYDYNKCNYSAAHVHMMLSTALTKMIDKTECLFFLNTPNSITPAKVIQNTESPWIYSEIAMTQLIRVKTPDQHRRRLVTALYSENMQKAKSLKIKYGVDLNHLRVLDEKILLKWNKALCIGNEDSLNALYNLT